MANGYKYDAFISYRHAELDKFVAENLHRKLESYKISKKVLSNGRTSRSKIERVFRDKDELPITNNLEDPIVKALSESEYLIVICTPRLKESIWCKKEIETFISMHGRDKIFAVLAEGEPYESFPEEILYREEQVQYPDGTVGTRLAPAEPLAADVRGKNKKEILKAMDVELLRLLAPMLGVDFDDLRQRHRERKFKKIITATVAAAVLCLGIGIASTITALHINKQKEKIEAQSVEIQAQASEIASQSDAIQAQNQKLLDNQAESLAEEAMAYLEDGNREMAIEVATSALTEYEGIPMPYTPEAQYALTESLHVYDAGSKIKPMYQIVMPSKIDKYSISPDKSKVVCRDAIGTIAVWDVTVGEQIALISEVTDEVLINSETVEFLDDNNIVYLTGEGELVKYNVAENSEVCRIKPDSNTQIITDRAGKYVIAGGLTNINVYDASGDEFKLISSMAPSDGYIFGTKNYISDSGRLVYVESRQEEIDEIFNDTDKDLTDYCQLHIYDMGQRAETSVIPINYEGINTVTFDGDYMYYAMSNYLYGGVDRLVKYDMSKNQAVWDVEMENLVTSICLPSQQGNDILAIGSLESFLVDVDTGAQLSRIDFASAIVNAYAVGENSYEIITNNSDYGQYHVKSDSYVIYDGYFEKNYDNLAQFYKTEYGYIVQGLNDNKLTYYEVSMGSDIALYEREINSEGIGSVADKKDEVAGNIHLEKANLIDTILYNDDKSVMFVSYSDKTVEIYSIANEKLLKTLEDVEDDIDVYYGKDDNGYTYIGGYSYGYILDEEYNLLARPEMLRGVNFDAELLIVQVGDEYGSYPIYTVEELVVKAKQILN